MERRLVSKVIVDLPNVTATVTQMLSNNLAWALPILLGVGAVSWAIRLVVGRSKLR